MASDKNGTMSTETFGQLCAERLWEAKQPGKPPLTRPQIINIIDALIKEQGYHKARRKVDGRNVLFDSLAAACGVNTNEITPYAGARIGKAMSNILAACPAVTPEEIAARVDRYRRFHPTWTVTPTAIASHWPALGGGWQQSAQTTPPKLAFDTQKEPDRWQELVSKALLNALPDDTKWENIGPALRQRIVRECMERKALGGTP